MSQITLRNIASVEDSFGPDDPASSTGAGFSWRSAHRTDAGRVRHLNEDALLDSARERLWVVADGMGGHSRGDYASNAVVKQLLQFSRTPSLSTNLLDLEARLVAVNEQCRTAFRDKRPGTTVAAMFAHANHCFLLWAGDSRIYRLRNQQLTQLTLDHTLAQQKHALGELNDEERSNHHTAHVLTKAVGVHKRLQLDLSHSNVQSGDRYLLCSDGLYNPVASTQISSLLASGTPDEACEALLASALAGGGRDNITVIVVDARAFKEA